MPYPFPRSLRRMRRTPLVALVPLLGLLAMMLTGGGAGHAGNLAVTEMDHALDATLVLRRADEAGGFLGSGTLWGDGDKVVTAAHVVKGETTVRIEDRHGRSITAPVSARDTRRDIAVLDLPKTIFGLGLEPAGTLPATGDEVFALGAPLQAAGSVTRGIVSAPARQVEANVPVRLIQHDAAINPGSSGGPLVGSDGALLGINSRIADGSRLFAGIAYAIPAATAEAMLRGDLPPVPDLGLTLRPVTERIARLLGLDTATGVLVDDVTEGGRAWQAGVEPGDVLLSLGGQPIRAPGDLAMILGGAEGGTLRLVIWRDGSEASVPLDLAPEAPKLGSLSLAAPGAGFASVRSYTWKSLGVTLDEGTDRIAALTRASPAWQAGLAEGDAIRAINGEEPSPQALAAWRIEGPLLMRVERNGRQLHVIVDPWATKPPEVPRGGANALDPAVVVF